MVSTETTRLTEFTFVGFRRLALFEFRIWEFGFRIFEEQARTTRSFSFETG
jgi:hypothetical protein